MEIYYQDNDIIVCYKPYGVSSQKSDGESMLSLISELTHTEVFPVHRLDVTTEGLMVYALTGDSAASLSAQISGGEMKKSYIALVHGNAERLTERTLTDYLYHDKAVNKSFVADKKRRGVKEAILDFSCIGFGVSRRSQEISAVKICLRTGRTHQIRVQFASRGLPLYGDRKYGAKSNSRILLFSSELSFRHPKTAKQLCFKIPEEHLLPLFSEFEHFTSSNT